MADNIQEGSRRVQFHDFLTQGDLSKNDVGSQIAEDSKAGQPYSGSDVLDSDISAGGASPVTKTLDRNSQNAVELAGAKDAAGGSGTAIATTDLVPVLHNDGTLGYTGSLVPDDKTIDSSGANGTLELDGANAAKGGAGETQPDGALTTMLKTDGGLAYVKQPKLPLTGTDYMVLQFNGSNQIVVDWVRFTVS